jgi:protein SCO1
MRKVPFAIFCIIMVVIAVNLALFVYSIAGEAEEAETPALLGDVIDPPLPLTDFTLTTTEGETFTLSEQKDKITLIYFGYLTCPDFCPAALGKLSKIYTELGEGCGKRRGNFRDS